MRLHPNTSHDHVESFLRDQLVLQSTSSPTSSPTASPTTSPDAPGLTIHHRYGTLLHGLVVSGVDLEDIYSHPGVDDVVEDSLRFATEYAWGPDRLVTTITISY